MINLPEQEALVVPFSIEEARAALFSMHGLKEPGPHGIQPFFLQREWEVISEKVLSFMNLALSEGKSEANKTHLT